MAPSLLSSSFSFLVVYCYPSESNQPIGKAKVINLAIQDIGMGRYQWELYILCGLGWVADK